MMTTTTLPDGRRARRRWRGWLLALLVLAGCAAPVPREHASALTPLEAGDTWLGQWAALNAVGHPGESGVALLASGQDAFRLRALLADQAERALDIQTYAMGDDLTTRLLLQRLLGAAEGGVRVRLLLDDLDAAGQGERLAALDSHPRIQVRVYNALAVGRSSLALRVLASLPQASRQHRRMHNKLWLADGAVAIVGGRNLGDEYYSAGAPRNFTDLDLMAIGAVVPSLARSFDLYWNHGLAQPLARFHQASPSAWRALAEGLAAWREADAPYLAALRRQSERGQRTAPVERLHWGEAVALWDPPGKLAWPGRPPLARTLAGALLAQAPTPAMRLTLIFAYFVPGKGGTEWLAALAEAGVEVAVITNALEATDVPLVHGAYQRHRPVLIDRGVALHELKSTSATLGERDAGLGASASALHIKALAIDGEWLFVGSANADPRSVWWNSEIGLLVRSDSLVGAFRALVDRGTHPALSYRVAMSPAGRLTWETRVAGVPQRLEQEPGSRWRHFLAWLGRMLPLAPWL
ncbi:phospholipase D family protein [Halomonas sp. NO4]|uniref:phospholipase D family protein n=1 Tax=Halomonas sp. NO4 TaxID=2484813 RepID=UPI001F0907FB|nr:phospholipase D family protein [Halomonas sp. NO4]